MRPRTTARRAALAAVLALTALAAAPAAADCAGASVTYTSPSGSKTTAGRCAPTAYPTLFSYSDETGTSATGYVGVSVRVVAP